MNSKRQFFRFFSAQFFVTIFVASYFWLTLDRIDCQSLDQHPAVQKTEKLLLRDDWTLQSSVKVEAKGEVISTADFVPEGWHKVTVPTTVVAALVKDKTVPDPFFAMYLLQFAGVIYPIG